MQEIPDSFVLSEADMNTIYQNKGAEFAPVYTLSTPTTRMVTKR